MSARVRRSSLRRDIVLWYSVVLVLALGIFSGLTLVLLRQALEWTGRASLRQTAQAVENLYVPPTMPRVATREQVYHLPQRDAQVVRRRTVLASGDTIETWLARDERIEHHVLRTFLLIAVLLIPLTALLAAAGGRMLLERLLAPLDELVHATREIGIGGLSRRVPEPERPRELHELAHSFNGMLHRLESAVQALGRFTADASHELRTPLTSIRGTVQVALARPRSADELEDTLGEVLDETDSMLHLVDGLLTLARGEQGGSRMQHHPVDLGPLLADVAEVGHALTEGRPVTVELNAPDGLVVQGVAGQLRQVFLNLVANAVKFTEQGRVTIHAERVTQDPDVNEEEAAHWVEVRVEDTGVGISEDELPRVFDRFYRGDAARGRPGGTGLGLAIARFLVEQHGGRIEVRSRLGAGSTFTVFLPSHDPGPAVTSAAS